MTDRDKDLKWNGWGYADAYFYVDEKTRAVKFAGEKYELGGKTLPHLRTWMETNLGVDLDFRTPSQPTYNLSLIPERRHNVSFEDALRTAGIPLFDDKRMRLARCHGHTVFDIIRLRQNGATFPRVPDVVVFPTSQDEVVTVVKAAQTHDVCLIPIGGGTSVSGALECPAAEQRMIVSLDMTRMAKVIWVDEDTQTARAEAGIIGQELERRLNEKGFTMGHEPDSLEFSSLGGWVATRASGMKKNRYGNIEDLVIHVSLVTASGDVLEKSCAVPRISAGPDLHQIIMGSEGTLGVVTEVTFKIFPLPECKRYGSVLFPSFTQGVAMMREVARQRCQPASLRLVDNEQFLFAQALKPPAPSYLAAFTNSLKKLYVTLWKRFDPAQMCVATLVMEGSEEEVAAQESRLYEIAAQFSGMPAGAENGRYGYMLTFAIAYLRDLGFEYSCLGESFETAVPWDRVVNVCDRVKELLHSETKLHGITYPIFASCRVTQVYDTGACIYFYFGFNCRGLPEPLEVYEEIENKARNEILQLGGSVSHHHGIGKIRKQYLPLTVGQNGIEILRAIKKQLDPKNIFGAGNLIDYEETIPRSKL